MPSLATSRSNQRTSRSTQPQLPLGPDVQLSIKRGEEEAKDITVSWDQSFQDVLDEVEKLYNQRYTLQFVHGQTPQGEEQQQNSQDTTVNVEDDDMFEVMIEYALDQPGQRLCVQAAEAHWWPKDDGTSTRGYKTVKSNSSKLFNWPVCVCYRQLWNGPLKMFTVDHWYSPMSPVNLFMSAGSGLILSLFLAVACYDIAKTQTEAVEDDITSELDVTTLGALVAFLSGPTFAYAFFIRRNQVGVFILLRLMLIGVLNTLFALFNLGIFCWVFEETGMVGSVLWLGASLVFVSIHFKGDLMDLFARMFHRHYFYLCRKGKVVVEDDEEEAALLLEQAEKGKEEKNSAKGSPAGTPRGEREEEEPQQLRKRDKLYERCTTLCAPLTRLANFIGRILYAVWMQVTWERVTWVVLTILHILKRLFEAFILLMIVGCGVAISYKSYADLIDTFSKAPGQLLEHNANKIMSHMVCMGSAPEDDRHPRPAVILASMEMLGQALAFSQLQARIATEGIVCTYDRAGLGRSAAGGVDRSAEKIATELAYLLVNGSNLGPPSYVVQGSARPILPPFILAGHSAGSIYMRQFAMMYPELTAAIVSFDGLPLLGNGPNATDTYQSDLQTYLNRDVLWVAHNFINPLGIAYGLFPILREWYLPGITGALSDAWRIRNSSVCSRSVTDPPPKCWNIPEPPFFNDIAFRLFKQVSVFSQYQELRWLSKPRSNKRAFVLAPLIEFEAQKRSRVLHVVWARAKTCIRNLPQEGFGCKYMLNSASKNWTLNKRPASWYDVQLSLASTSRWERPAKSKLPILRYNILYPPPPDSTNSPKVVIKMTVDTALTEEDKTSVREGFAAAAGVLMHYVLVSLDARRQMTYTVSVYVEDAGMAAQVSTSLTDTTALKTALITAGLAASVANSAYIAAPVVVESAPVDPSAASTSGGDSDSVPPPPPDVEVGLDQIFNTLEPSTLEPPPPEGDFGENDANSTQAGGVDSNTTDAGGENTDAPDSGGGDTWGQGGGDGAGGEGGGQEGGGVPPEGEGMLPGSDRRAAGAVNPADLWDKHVLRSTVRGSREFASLQGGEVTESMFEAVLVAWRLLNFD